MGIAPDRLILEERSRNTDENAERTAELLGSQGGTVVLVTSAFHMPRSVGLFRSAGIEVVPWPVDYRSAGTQGFGIDIANPVLNLNTTGIGHEQNGSFQLSFSRSRPTGAGPMWPFNVRLG